MTPPIPLLPGLGFDSFGRGLAEEIELPGSLIAELEATLDQWGLYLLQFEHTVERERAAAELERRFSGGMRVYADEHAHPDWPALRFDIETVAAQATFVQVFGLESWLSPSALHGQAEVRLRAWNRGRDGFARQISVPVLLWLLPEQIPLVARWAPDLWSWRSAVHSVSAPGHKSALFLGAAPLLDPRWESGIDTRTAAQRRARIDELQAYLDSEAAAQASPALRLSYLLESVDLLRSLGDIDQALQTACNSALPLAVAQGAAYAVQVQSRIADMLESRGELEEALRIRREEQMPVFERLGDVRSIAITHGKIAGVLQSRGELGEALRIYREELLPVFDRLDDARSRAITQSRIADILQARGELDEALRIHREKVLPVFKRLGDIQECAITQIKIADILEARGELEEALRIRREEILPVFESLGDVRSRAITQGRIADILQARGEVEAALRIRREEMLPVFERLGDVRSRAVTQSQIADTLEEYGNREESIRIYREDVLPVYERLGDVRMLLVDRTNLAIKLITRGRAEDRPEILSLLQQALHDAERLGLPEAETIRGWIAGVFGPDASPPTA